MNKPLASLRKKGRVFQKFKRRQQEYKGCRTMNIRLHATHLFLKMLRTSLTQYPTQGLVQPAVSLRRGALCSCGWLPRPQSSHEGAGGSALLADPQHTGESGGPQESSLVSGPTSLHPVAPTWGAEGPSFRGPDSGANSGSLGLKVHSLQGDAEADTPAFSCQRREGLWGNGVEPGDTLSPFTFSFLPRTALCVMDPVGSPASRSASVRGPGRVTWERGVGAS